MIELIKYILTSVLKHPDNINVTEEITELGHIYKISVNPEDLGLLIGKNGDNIKAISNIVKIKAKNDKIHASLVIDK